MDAPLNWFIYLTRALKSSASLGHGNLRGDYMHYSYDNLRPRFEVDGSRTGWDDFSSSALSSVCVGYEQL